MFIIFRDSIHVPLAKIGFMALGLAYLSFLVYNIVTPAYLNGAFFTNPSAFAALKFLPVYLLVSTLVVLVIAAALYAYIEIGRYKQQVAFLTEKRSVLKVRVPGDVRETLASMEAVIEMISYGSGESLWFPVWWEGQKRPLYSFEIISRGGTVVFLITTRTFLVDAVRSAIFAFYPRAQVLESDDYAYDIEYLPEEHTLFPFEWKFSRGGALPIKTYIEFQMEKRNNPGALSGTNLPAQQPSPLVDPLASLYDLLGSLRGDEQIWVQYVFRTQKYARPADDAAEDPTDRAYWKKQKLPKDIQDALIALEEKVLKGRGEGVPPVVLTESEKRLREIGPRLREKQALEVGIRMVYVASKDSFTFSRLSPLMTVYKLTSTEDNSLIPHSTILDDVYQVPVLEPPRKDKEAERLLLLQLYRDRLFWYAPAIYTHQPSDERGFIKRRVVGPSKRRISMVMTSETLTTICHFPTAHIKTPSVQRVLSTTVEPPDNLPV